MSDEAGKPTEVLPRPEEILASLNSDDRQAGQLERYYIHQFREDAVKSEVDWTHLRGLQSHYWHKGNWSWALMAIMAFMIGFQSYVIYMVGSKQWDFTEYVWLLPALLVQNLGQIIALAFVVVRSLFR